MQTSCIQWQSGYMRHNNISYMGYYFSFSKFRTGTIIGTMKLKYICPWSYIKIHVLTICWLFTSLHTLPFIMLSLYAYHLWCFKSRHLPINIRKYAAGGYKQTHITQMSLKTHLFFLLFAGFFGNLYSFCLDHTRA